MPMEERGYQIAILKEFDLKKDPPHFGIWTNFTTPTLVLDVSLQLGTGV